MFQTVDINIVPTGEMPVVNVSQYDVNRVIRFCLLNDGETYTPTNFLKAEFIIRKVDGTLFTQETTVLVSNVLELVTTEQMTACAGKNIGEIRLTFNDPDISEDDVIISTLNFILDVERSPETGGIESESEIANLDGQIAAIVDEQLENYYTKSEIDDQIEEIVSEQVTPIVSGIVAEQVPPIVQAELGNYYTKDETDTYFYNKTETDTLLSGKADVSSLPDMTTYYTKTETDTLLAGKVSNSTLNDYYTKTQVDNLISSVSTDFTTSIDTPASVQTFTDGGDNIPMKSCIVDIDDQSGISSVTISVRGQNYIDMSTLAMRDVAADHTQRAGFAPVTLPAGTYKVFLVFTGTARSIYAQNAVSFESIANGNSDFTFTLTETTSVLIRTTFMTVETATAAITNISMFDTGTITDTTVSLGQTVYDGSADVVNGTGMSGGVPFTFTGANIPTLSGVNNVYADSGDINALEYFNNKADDIAKMIELMNR